MLIDADWYADWCWLMLTDADWLRLMLIDADWFWLILIDFDWCWLILIEADWFWWMLIDAPIRFNQVYVRRRVPPELLRSFLIVLYQIQIHQIPAPSLMRKNAFWISRWPLYCLALRATVANRTLLPGHHSYIALLLNNIVNSWRKAESPERY